MRSREDKPIHTTLYLTLMKLKAILIELAIAHDTLIGLGLKEQNTKLRVAYGILKETVNNLEDLTNTELIREEILRIIEQTNKTSTPE